MHQIIEPINVTDNALIELYMIIAEYKIRDSTRSFSVKSSYDAM